MTEREQLPVQEARAGSAQAWDALFKRYQLPLYVYVFELVHDEQPSLDIVQETFISAARNVVSLRDDGKFGNWLFGIAHQKCIQRWRKQSREEALLDELGNEAPDLHEASDDWLIRQEREEEFMKALNQLPLPQRAVLLLFFVEEFSLEDTAGIVGASIGTVKSRLHYGKLALRRILSPAGPKGADDSCKARATKKSE